MKNYLNYLFPALLSVFCPLLGMDELVVYEQQQQFLPQDLLRECALKCDLQSLGRLATTCQYIRNNLKVEKLPPQRFDLVEKCLYYYAPQISFPVCTTDSRYKELQEIKQRLSTIVHAQQKQIDISINEVYLAIKTGNFGGFFTDKLELTHEDRIAFYFGKLPGQIKGEYDDSDECDYLDEEIANDPTIYDVLDAAHEDARFAIYAGDIDRAKVVLNRYEQFPNYENKLMSALCFLGNAHLLLNYLSIPERGIEYATDENNRTALELANVCQDQELVDILQNKIDEIRKSQDEKLMAFVRQNPQWEDIG